MERLAMMPPENLSTRAFAKRRLKRDKDLFRAGFVEREKGGLPLLHWAVALAKFVVILEQGRTGLLSGLGRIAPKPRAMTNSPLQAARSISPVRRCCRFQRACTPTAFGNAGRDPASRRRCQRIRPTSFSTARRTPGSAWFLRAGRKTWARPCSLRSSPYFPHPQFARWGESKA